MERIIYYLSLLMIVRQRSNL